MLIHSEKINPCKCGSHKKPDLDSDDFSPCWAIQCFDCRQFVNDNNWTKNGAVRLWNIANPIKTEDENTPF